MTNNQIAYLNLQEQKRSHLANESYNLDSLAETTRHNVATEDFNLSNLAETVRSNKAKETEIERHNKRTEGETVRHNLESEGIQKTSALADKAYKEAVAALNSERLTFDKSKEVTRIAESLRDYLERVRVNDLNALTSTNVLSLVESLSNLLSDSDDGSIDTDNINVTVNTNASDGANSSNSTTKPTGGRRRGRRMGSGVHDRHSDSSRR